MHARSSSGHRPGSLTWRSRARILVGALALLCSAVALPATHARAQTAPTFHGTGDLPGGPIESVLNAVSADGGVAVGSSEGVNGREAYRWTVGGGMQALGVLYLPNPDSEARGISADGLTIAGTSLNANGNRAFRWTSGGGMVALGTYGCTDCDPETAAAGISPDGLTIVGVGLRRSGTNDPVLNASRWAGGGNGISDLGDLSGGGDVSTANDASQTGSIIVGFGDNSGAENLAFYWSGGTMNALPTVGGAVPRAGAQAISSDGTTIVGFVNTNTGHAGNLEAVRWTGAGFSTLTLLGALPGSLANSSEANAVSNDGSIIVGRARDNVNSDHAFIWDSTHGMRALADVATTDYGVDLGAWVLEEATGISDIGVNGGFTVVGTGINPNGFQEGFVLYLVTPACSDGVDNGDGDGLVDYPNDPECTGPLDYSELIDCADGIDNDNDGDIDAGNDAECNDAADQSETPDCGDGYDNDGDGNTDFPADIGCGSLSMLVEDPACNDGIDNDGDTATDYPADLSCVFSWDLSERPDCFDGFDNDGDGNTDFPFDSGCDNANDQSEAHRCSDGIDNDLDGVIDYPAEYPDCVSATDNRELPQCSDGLDNDGDGNVDFPLDTGCTSGLSRREDPVDVAALDGMLVVVDRKTKTVFSVDTGTGVQSLISQSALLQAPQGFAQRSDTTMLVADSVGLVEISDGSGAQRIASGPLVDGEGLQVVVDGGGAALVLEALQITSVSWNPVGLGVHTPLLTLPTTELPFPLISNFQGDSLAFDNAGDLLVTGLSLYGDGVARVDPGTLAVTLVQPGFSSDTWVDLAVEQDDTIVAVGTSFSDGPGVYRIDPVSGAVSILNSDVTWTKPTGVAIDANGDIYVADSGICIGITCINGRIVHVDPGSGVATQLSSGGYIGGLMDVAVLVPEPAGALPWVAGMALLRVLGRRRVGSR